MQPLQYDLRSPAAKDNSITHAAKRGSNTCNPIYTAGTILQLQSTMEFHRQLLHQHHLQSHLQWGNDPRVANHNGIPSATHPPAPLATPFTMRERSYSCKSQWNSVDHTCTKNSWNPIYNAEPIREWSENIRPWSDHTRDRLAPVAPQRYRSSRFGDELCMEKHRLSCICYLSKTHFVRDFLQNSIGNSSTSTTCNPIYSEGTILELQITMEFHRQLIHQHHLQPHLQCGNDSPAANHNGILSTAHARNTGETPFTMRNRSEHDPRISDHDPTTHETVSHPSHRRGRSSRFGDGLCMEKHRLSCICYLSKMHFVRDFLQNSIGNSSTSTTCNPIYSEGTILELQITMEFHRQLIHQHHLQPHLQCGNDPTVANHNGILSTTHARNTGETPFTMRNRSEHDPRISDHDPTTHETISHPSHRRGRSSTFGDGLCMEKHRVSCICYLSKTHFVRDFLQNSIGNSSTSTTCNPIYSEGTILELQITMEFHRQLIHQHHLQPHLQCGNDPTVANHNGILSTTHARNTGETPFTMRNRSEHDPRISDHDPTTHETVSHPSHRRGRSSTFGDGLCMEKHRVSCICYLSKTHFVRDFLQNSMGNSSTSTTCNPIYSEGTISLLTLSVTNSFPH